MRLWPECRLRSLIDARPRLPSPWPEADAGIVLALDGELAQPHAAGTCRARTCTAKQTQQVRGTLSIRQSGSRRGPSTICNQPATFFTSEGGSTHNIHVARMIRTVKEGGNIAMAHTVKIVATEMLNYNVKHFTTESPRDSLTHQVRQSSSRSWK